MYALVCKFCNVYNLPSKIYCRKIFMWVCVCVGNGTSGLNARQQRKFAKSIYKYVHMYAYIHMHTYNAYTHICAYLANLRIYTLWQRQANFALPKMFN